MTFKSEPLIFCFQNNLTFFINPEIVKLDRDVSIIEVMKLNLLINNQRKEQSLK